MSDKPDKPPAGKTHVIEGPERFAGSGKVTTDAEVRRYENDVVLWAEDQSQALRNAARAASHLPSDIDWENIAEEIESLGKSQGRERASRISTILVHLMKLQASPANHPHANWRETIRENRAEIERLLDDAPSLRRTVPSVISKETPKAWVRAQQAMADYDERPSTDLSGASYTEDQVLGPWFPGDPPATL